MSINRVTKGSMGPTKNHKPGTFKRLMRRERPGGLGASAHQHADTQHIMTSRTIDSMATTQVGDRIRSEAVRKVEDWRTGHWMHGVVGFGPRSPAPLREELREAQDFEQLPEARQRELAGPQLEHLLYNDNQFGTPRVSLAEGFTPDLDSVMVGLSAQRHMEQSRIPGEITFISLDDGVATFEVEDQGLTHELAFADNRTQFTLNPAAPTGGGSALWQQRAVTTSTGSDRVKLDMHCEDPEDVASRYEKHHEQSMLFEVLASSPLQRASSEISDVDFKNRMVGFEADGRGYSLRLHDEVPEVHKGHGGRCTAEEAQRLLAHLASTTRQPSGAELYTTLRGIFTETGQRLQR